MCKLRCSQTSSLCFWCIQILLREILSSQPRQGHKRVLSIGHLVVASWRQSQRVATTYEAVHGEILIPMGDVQLHGIGQVLSHFSKLSECHINISNLFNPRNLWLLLPSNIKLRRRRCCANQVLGVVVVGDTLGPRHAHCHERFGTFYIKRKK